MPRWLLLIMAILGCSLVVPLFVLGLTSNLRAALVAWRKFLLVLCVLAAPGLIIGMAQSIQR